MAGSSGTDILVCAAKQRLASFPSITLARLREYILYNGPDEWGYSPAAAMLAWKGIGPRPGVYASYVRGERIFCTFDGVYRLIDHDWHSGGLTNAFGCRHVPRLESVLALRNLTTFCDWSIPSCLSECRLKWNASIAGLHLIGCVLLGGIRNFMGSPPPSAAWSDAFVMNQEKLHLMPTIFSEHLRQGLQDLEIAERKAQNLFRIRPPRPANSAYGFWLDDDTACEISPSRVRLALKEYPQTSYLADLHPNAMRALAMTILYEDGRLHTNDIERFFGRAFSAMTPLRAHRLEPALDSHLTRTIEQTIISHVRL